MGRSFSPHRRPKLSSRARRGGLVEHTTRGERNGAVVFGTESRSFASRHLPCLSTLVDAPLLGNRHYFRAYFSCGPGDRNRCGGRGHILRRRPSGREGPVSNQTPHEPVCPNRVTCSDKLSATSTRRRSLKN